LGGRLVEGVYVSVGASGACKFAGGLCVGVTDFALFYG
jgi:hypothetical protein